MLSLSSILVLATHAALYVTAQSIEDSPIVDFTLQQLNEAMADPDAEGQAALPREAGKDLTTKWPGKSLDGWGLRIEIKMDVPVSESGYTTLTRISYVPPKSVEVKSNATSSWTPTDQTWYPCSNLWVSELRSTSSDEVDDECNKILPSACRSDLQDLETETFFGDFESEWRGPQCPMTQVPDSCADAFGKGRWLAAEPSDDSNPGLFHLNMWYYFEGDDVHAKGDNSAYKAALDRVWVVGTGWGYSKFSEYANGTSQALNGSISCLKAADASASRSGEGRDGDGEGKGGSQQDGEDAALTVSCNLGLAIGAILFLLLVY